MIANTTKDKEWNVYAVVVMLWFLAEDSDTTSKAREFDTITLQQIGNGNLNLQQLIEAYSSVFYWIVCELCSFITENYLGNYREYFEYSDGLPCWHIINSSGKDKLKKEYIDIWNEFNLEDIQKQ